MGRAERAARADLRVLPKYLRASAIAISYMALARRLDSGVSAREAVTLARELRMCLLSLYDLAPPQVDEDFVDELSSRREARMKTLPQAQRA